MEPARSKKSARHSVKRWRQSVKPLKRKQDEHDVIRSNCSPTHLVFVGRIERYFAYFLVLLSRIHHITDRQLSAFQQGDFGRITHAFS